MVTALLIAFVWAPIIGRLRAHKVGQIVRADGPATHLGKRGTPTMGGLIVLLATVVPTVLWARLDNRFVLVALFATCGWARSASWTTTSRSCSGAAGLVARYKMAGQVSFGLALGLACCSFPWTARSCAVGDHRAVLQVRVRGEVLAVPYVVWVTFIVTGSSNAVNLTDGLDGLAAGLSAIAADHLRGLRVPLRPRGRVGVPQGLLPARRGRAGDLLREPDGGLHRLPVVQRPPGAGVHGRHRLARHRRRARDRRHPPQGRVPAGSSGRRVRGGSRLGDAPDQRVQVPPPALRAGVRDSSTGCSGWRRCTTTSRSSGGPSRRW